MAYRFFTTERRKFIVADTPGHEQYTRNMVTGASTADVAVILVDARKGVLTQTRRHSFIVSLLGIKHVALAVNNRDRLTVRAAAVARGPHRHRGEQRGGVGGADRQPAGAPRGSSRDRAPARIPRRTAYPAPPLKAREVRPC